MRSGLLILYFLFSLLTLILLPVAAIDAKQLLFDKKEKSGKIFFSYLYQDDAKNTEELGFSLSQLEIDKAQSLLLDDAALNRAASDFIFIEGKETADKYLATFQHAFDIAIQGISNSIATFNSNLGTQVVTMKLKAPGEISLSLELTGEQLLDIQVSSVVPGMQFVRNNEAFISKFLADMRAIVAQANRRLPDGLSFSISLEGDSIRFPLKNENRAYDTGTSARARQEIRKTNARLRSRLEQRNKQAQEVNAFVEGTKLRAKKIIDTTVAKLADARKDVIADMKARRVEFYAAHYLLSAKKNKELVLIDYARVVNQSINGLKPVARAFKGQEQNQRKTVAKVLHFFQNIPYNDLTQGKVRGFRGFSPPLEMLAANRGDCDSKSTAMMAVLQTLTPNLEVAIFIVPKHAFLGVAIPAKKSDTIYTHEGITYVLMEPTGPRVRPIGSLIQSSYDYLQSGQIDEIITLQ